MVKLSLTGVLALALSFAVFALSGTPETRTFLADTAATFLLLVGIACIAAVIFWAMATSHQGGDNNDLGRDPWTK